MSRKDDSFNTACEVISTYHRFLSAMRYEYNSGPGGDEDHYGFIPNNPKVVITALTQTMDLLKKHNPLPYPEARDKYTGYKFLDAGCGAGNIMIIAQRLGFDVWGIERDEKTIKVARNLLYYTNRYKQGRGIIKADLIKYRKYGEYDVIYYYQPMHSYKMGIFVNALFNQMKVGAVVVPFGTKPLPVDKRFKLYKCRDENRYYIGGIYRKTKP